MTEKIEDKYIRLRPLIKHGDLILFNGNKALARIIQKSDSNCKWNHVGLIIEVEGALFIIDSNRTGVHPERLSERVHSYNDFILYRSLKTKPEIKLALRNLLKKQDEVEINYDFINGGKSLINRYFKTNLKIKNLYNKNICSVFVLPYALELKMVMPLNRTDSLFFPQDYIRQMHLARIIK